MDFSTVDLTTSIPIFLGSPTMHGAPHSGLEDDICWIRSRTSFETVGRPRFPDRIGFVQCSRNFRLRQPITVLG